MTQYEPVPPTPPYQPLERGDGADLTRPSPRPHGPRPGGPVGPVGPGSRPLPRRSDHPAYQRLAAHTQPGLPPLDGLADLPDGHPSAHDLPRPAPPAPPAPPPEPQLDVVFAGRCARQTCTAFACVCAIPEAVLRHSYAWIVALHARGPDGTCSCQPGHLSWAHCPYVRAFRTAQAGATQRE